MPQATNTITIHVPSQVSVSRTRKALLLAALISAMIPSFLFAQQTSKKLRLLSPVGGETFKPGDTVTIRWGGTDNETISSRKDTVRIELSTNGGGSWQQVADVAVFRERPTQKYDSTYRWVVPSTLSNSCILQIRQISGDMGTGESVGSFQVGYLGGADGLTSQMAVLFSNVDSLLAVKTNDTIVLWDIHQKAPVRTFVNPHRNQFFSDMRFSRDDAFLITGVSATKADDTAWVLVWDVQTGEIVHAFPQLAGLAGGVAITLRGGSLNPEGTRLLMTGGFQALLQTIPGDDRLDTVNITDRSLTGEFSPDGKRVAIGGTAKFGVWDAETRENIYQFPTACNFIEYSGDGQYLLLSSSSFTSVVNASTGKGIFSVGSSSLNVARFAHNTDRFILSADRRAVDFGNTATYRLNAPDTSSYTRSAITPFGRIAAVVSIMGKVDLWDITGIPSDTMNAPFSIDGPVSVDERGVAGGEVAADLGLSVSVRPNPAVDAVTILCRAAEANPLELILFDMNGRSLDQVDLGRVEPGIRSFRYDVGNLPAGVYRFEVRGEKRVAGQTLVVVH